MDVALIVEAFFRMPERASELWQGALELDGVESCASSFCAFGASSCVSWLLTVICSKGCACGGPHRASRGAAARADFCASFGNAGLPWGYLPPGSASQGRSAAPR